MPVPTTNILLSPKPAVASSPSSAKDKSLFGTLSRKIDESLKAKPRDPSAKLKPDKFKDELNRASESSKKTRRERDDVEGKPAPRKSAKASSAKKASKPRKLEGDEPVDEAASESAAPTEDGTIESTTDVEETDAPVDETNPDHDIDGETDETAVDPNLAAAINAQNSQVRSTTTDAAHDEGEPTDETADDAIDGSASATVLKSAANAKMRPEGAIEAIDGDEETADDEDVDPNASQLSSELPDESLTDPDAQDVAKTSKKGAATPASHAKSESSTWGAAPVSPANATKANAKTEANADANAAINAVEIPDVSSEGSDDADRADKATKAVDASSSFAKTLEMFGGDAPKQAAPMTGPNGQPPVAKLPPDQQFATDNHPNIVSNVRGNLLPTGGTMHIRLDPPELGQMQISVNVRDGVMTATFETSNDEATRMLSHSLGELKGALEASGVAVDKLHVQQAPKNDQPSDKRGDGSGSQQGHMNDSSARREQERKELLRRMWDKLTNGADPLDTVG